MIRNWWLLWPMVLILSSSCGNPAKEPEAGTDLIPPQREEISEDDLLVKLMPYFYDQPEGTNQIEQNQIIDYAIANKVPAEVTASGLFYDILEEGSGELIRWGDRISVHYQGSLIDGTEFDSSYQRGRPLEIYVGNMIDGWNEGLQLLKPGGRAQFIVPSHLGYGAEGFKNRNGATLVPPDAILIFDVKVIKLIKAAN